MCSSEGFLVIYFVFIKSVGVLCKFFTGRPDLWLRTGELKSTILILRLDNGQKAYKRNKKDKLTKKRMMQSANASLIYKIQALSFLNYLL